MKRISLYFLLLISLLCAQEQKGSPRRIRELIARSRSLSPDAPHQKYFARIALQYCRSNLVRKSMPMITRAWRLFTGIKGFAETVVHLDRQTSGVHGHIFEVESALAYANEGEEVLALNQHVGAPGASRTREFDIITVAPDGTKKYIECKNVNWKNNSSKKRKQLSEQAAIVKGYQQLGHPVNYILRSKKPIPSNWKRWFHANNIAYEESE